MNQQVRLRRKEDRRLRGGHQWVFSNELMEKPTEAAPGDLVTVVSAGGESLGSALYHPHSLICARLLGGEFGELDEAFFKERIVRASDLRKRLFPGESSYRLVHGESDFLPGLIIDRFADYLVVQTVSAGMDRRIETIVRALIELFEPKGIIERNDSALRSYEGLPERKGVLAGEWPGPILMTENGVQYRVDLLEGQKTGFFFDQKLNRKAVAGLAKGLDVLDCFCNQGGFALNAARAGASSVVGIDVSDAAVAVANDNALLNGLENVEFRASDVFTFLRDCSAEGRLFDLVIVDPPSFSPRKKDIPKAKKAYRRLNELALMVLRDGGILATASCSYHLQEEVFYQLVNEAGVRAGKRLQLLEQRMQGPDHPVLLAMPETRYLKLGVFRSVG